MKSFNSFLKGKNVFGPIPVGLDPHTTEIGDVIKVMIDINLTGKDGYLIMPIQEGILALPVKFINWMLDDKKLELNKQAYAVLQVSDKIDFWSE